MPRSRPHPALSARILALGLSTMATFAMVAGYSLAEARTTHPETDPHTEPAPPVDVQPVSPQSPPLSTAAAPPPRSIQLPVPALPAQSGGNTQDSSGSK